MKHLTMKFLIAAMIALPLIALPLAIAATTAEAGGRHSSSWAGYDWGDSYPGWAAEAFQPGR